MLSCMHVTMTNRISYTVLVFWIDFVNRFTSRDREVSGLGGNGGGVIKPMADGLIFDLDDSKMAACCESFGITY